MRVSRPRRRFLVASVSSACLPLTGGCTGESKPMTEAELDALWHNVVKPVLAELTHTSGVSKGKCGYFRIGDSTR